jgi:DNA-binding transcriptional MerR regulator
MTHIPPPEDPVWAPIRLRYEQDQETVNAIAQDMGMAGVSLSTLAKKWGWTLRGKVKAALKPRAKTKAKAKAKTPTKPETTAATIKRVKELLQQRLTELEEQIKEIGLDVGALSNERQIRSTNMLVRTIEKVLDLERKDRLRRRKDIQDYKYFNDEQRQQLADKIERLQHAWRGDKTIEGVADDRRGGAEQPVALLGEAAKSAAAASD